jgi:alanyl-tRNA synthetase
MQAMRNVERKGGGRAEPTKLTEKELDELGRQKVTPEELKAIKEDINKKIRADYQAKVREEQAKKAQKEAMEEAVKKAKEDVEKKVSEGIAGQ